MKAKTRALFSELDGRVEVEPLSGRTIAAQGACLFGILLVPIAVRVLYNHT